MKNRKNKLTNIFKIGVFLFGMSILLSNCSEQDSLIETTNLVTTETSSSHRSIELVKNWLEENSTNDLVVSQVYNIHQWNKSSSKEIKTENGLGFTLDVPLTIQTKDDNYKIFARYIYKDESIKTRVFLKSIDFFKNNKANTNFVYPIVKTKDFLKIAERTSKKLSEYEFVKIENNNLLQRGGSCYGSSFWSDIWSAISGFFGGAWNGIRNAVNAIGSFFSNWGSSYSNYSPGGSSRGYGLYEFEEILVDNGDSYDPYEGWIQQELFYLPSTVTNGNMYHMNEYGKAVSNLALITQNIKNAYPNINEGEIVNAILEAHINSAYHTDIANGNLATVIDEVNLEDVIYDEHLWSILQKFTHGFFYESEYVTNNLTNALNNTDSYKESILLKILGFNTYAFIGVFNQNQLDWLANNPEQGKHIANFTNSNNNTNEAKTWAKGQIELETLTQNIPWQPSTGTVAGLRYTHTYFDGSRGYFKLEDDSIVVNSASEQILTASGDLRDKYNELNPNDRFYYIKAPGQQWAEMLFNPDNLADGLANLFQLAGIELGKSIGRYVFPIEDIKILIDGKDFDGQDVSKWQAAGFLLLAVVPGSKVLKVVGNVADATVFAIKLGGGSIVIDTVATGIRVVANSGSNLVRFLSQTGDEIARIANGVMTFKYNGFGGDIVTTANKTTTVIGKYNVNGIGTKNIIDSGLSKSGRNDGGLNVLNETPNSNWSDQQIWDNINEPWLRDSASRNDIIRVISDPNLPSNIYKPNGDLSFFGREHQLLTMPISQGGLGYTFNSSTFTYIR